MTRRCQSFRTEHRFVPLVDCDFSGSNRKSACREMLRGEKCVEVVIVGVDKK